LVQLATASGDGVAIQARDACQQSDPSAAVPLGEEASDKPPAALVGTSDEPFDRLVLTGNSPVGFPMTDRAGTTMEPLDIVLMGLGHRTLPP
jgi:hypothetical protein